jgi:hypothetical protein
VFRGRERHTPERGGKRALPLRRVLARESRCSTSGCPVAAMQLPAKGRGRPAVSVADSLRSIDHCDIVKAASDQSLQPTVRRGRGQPPKGGRLTYSDRGLEVYTL